MHDPPLTTSRAPGEAVRRLERDPIKIAPTICSVTKVFLFFALYMSVSGVTRLYNHGEPTSTFFSIQKMSALTLFKHDKIPSFLRHKKSPFVNPGEERRMLLSLSSFPTQRLRLSTRMRGSLGTNILKFGDLLEVWDVVLNVVNWASVEGSVQGGLMPLSLGLRGDCSIVVAQFMIICFAGTTSQSSSCCPSQCGVLSPSAASFLLC